MIRTENTLPHAHMRWGFNASSTGTRLLSLSTIADAKISNPPWVNFQSAGWVSFQSAPTVTTPYKPSEKVSRAFYEKSVSEIVADAGDEIIQPE
ncbi:hypothetical protein [Pseudomonas monsensis]|uniref:hypothetical protein n=1 Tax=Pseudomonas monsensis TaxID=2745509 RepID=UPI00300F454C